MDHPRLEPAARSGAFLTDVQHDEWIPLPDGATLTWLPNTRAVGIDPDTGDFVRVSDDAYAVGALLPQGFTRLLLPGYSKRGRASDDESLPLFGYTAVGWLDGTMVVAADATDKPEPWNPLFIDDAAIQTAVEKTLQQHPDNRLYEHLSHCALDYGCMTARNTFLGRIEGALPVSSTCNAACVGCISEQPDDAPFPSPQTRMTFRPSVDEIVQVIMGHLQVNPEAILSFGQGCEGEPATRWPDLVRVIRDVRSRTNAGYININTNGGLTKGLQAMVDAGLDMMRVSTISAVAEHYNAYYKPRGYDVNDVATTLTYAASQGVYTSINYLVFPGVTDREEEVEAMVAFLQKTDVKLIQMRNLNIDAEYYLSRIPEPKGDILGMKEAMRIYREACPGIVIGSYSHVPPQRRPAAPQSIR